MMDKVSRLLDRNWTDAAAVTAVPKRKNAPREGRTGTSIGERSYNIFVLRLRRVALVPQPLQGDQIRGGGAGKVPQKKSGETQTERY